MTPSIVGQLDYFIAAIEKSLSEDANLISLIGCDEDILVSADFGMDLEIAFRQYMERLLVSEKNDLLNSPASKFITFSVDFAEAFFSRCPSFARVPFQLIDDFLEDKNISQAKEIWPLLESLAEKLTSATLFPKGKFIMLKTCNFLLKKLSKSCDTEFCGRVLLFLAAIYPISEKSAANIAGRINTTNVTLFDNKDVFTSQVKNEKSESAQREDGEASDELDITYEIYENFWKLQTFFASEFKSLDQASPTWNDFVTNAKAVIDILKISAPNECTITASNKVTATENDKENHSNSYQGTKYLTSSQLFTLQLRDPQLRQQIAVQLLIFTHYLRVKSLPNIASVEQRVNFLKDICLLHNEAKKIIETMPGSMSADLITVIHRILEREENWIRWKSTGSNPFEKNELISVSGLKRKADEVLSAAAAQELKKEMRRALPPRKYTFDCSDSHIKQVVSQWEHSETDFADKMQEYIDADDPECGIDEEYHPKHNHLYCWRTRRMLAERDFSTFDVMLDGNLGKGLRKLKNLPEPVPKQPEEENATEEGNGEEELIGRPSVISSNEVKKEETSMDVVDEVEEGEAVEEEHVVEIPEENLTLEEDTTEKMIEDNAIDASAGIVEDEPVENESAVVQNEEEVGAADVGLELPAEIVSSEVEMAVDDNDAVEVAIEQTVDPENMDMEMNASEV